MSQDASATFRPLLKKLVETPESFTLDDFRSSLNHLLTTNALQPTQIGAFLTALHIRRLGRRPEFLAAAASLLRDKAVKTTVQDAETSFVVDIVGTGGDGHNLFNVSTTAAVVAAGAGARVIKHGNRASTSSSGSADLLEALGCPFPRPTPGTTTLIPNNPFTFILAPHYHPSLVAIASYRKTLPFRTIFNVIGPLINPARPRGMVLGVAEPELGYAFARALAEGGVDRAFVVCGCEKLDEISCAGPTHLWELRNGNIEERTICPEDFGLPTHPLSSVAGGTPKENAASFKTLLSSGNDIPKDMIPLLDFVSLNASALLVVAGVASDFVEGARLARESVVSGRAWAALEQFRDAGMVELNRS